MNAQASFSSLKSAIENACAEKNHLIVRDAALALGFVESDVSKAMTLALKYEHVEPGYVSDIKLSGF